MAEEKETTIAESLKYDWRNLGYSDVAGQYIKQLGQNGIPYAKKSLELILKDCDIKDSWIVKTVTDPAVLQKTIQSQLETYNRCKEGQLVGDLIDYHRDDLTNYLGDNMQYFEKYLNPLVGEKYEDVLKSVAKAKHIIKGKEHGISSDEEVKSAESTIKKYDNLTSTIDMLEQNKNSKFRTRVDNGMIKEDLNELYAPKKDSN